MLNRFEKAHIMYFLKPDRESMKKLKSMISYGIEKISQSLFIQFYYRGNDCVNDITINYSYTQSSK